jgi:hypothetical protein
MISDSDSSGSDVEWLAGASSVQDIFNLRNERSIAGFDRTHRLLVSFDYQLPVGRNRAFGKRMNRLVDGMIGGWEIGSIISASSGSPLVVTQSASNLWNSANQRPNLVGDPSLPGSPREKLNQYFNVNAFQQLGPDLIGSTPRYLTNYRGPSLINEDVSLMKSFHVTEKKYVQLRLEAYSVSNSPQWGLPNTSFGDPSFASAAGAPPRRAN